MKTPLIKTQFSQLRALLTLAAVFAAASLALAGNALWIGNPGVTTTTNWSDTANWSGSSHNPNNNFVFFDNGVVVSQAGLVNNVVDLSTNCYSLSYTNSVGFNTTLIAPGQTLTIVGNNGGPALLFIPGAQTSNTNFITGANGTLLLTGSSAGGVTVTVTNSGGTGVHPLLDLSGLGTFIISNAGSSAAINVGNSAVRPGGTLNLARTNFLNLPATGIGGSAAIVVGEATSNDGGSPGGVLNLGITNTIFAGNIGVGLAKQSAATLAFNPAFLANNPVAYIRGPGGSAVTNWAIGDGLNTSGTSIGPGGTVNFNGGTVNAVVNAMWLGKPSQTSATAPTAKGTLSFSAGTISVVNLTNGCALAPTTGGPGAATGTINVTGTGRLTVSNLVLAFLGVSTNSSTGTLNITNGTVQANNIIAGGGASTINLVGGTLIVTNTAGTVAQPLSALSVSNSTLTLLVASSSPGAAVTTLTVNGVGTANTLNISSVPSTTTLPAQYPVITYTTLNGTPDFTLGTLPAGCQGYLSNNVAHSSVDLVLTKTPTKNDTWNGNLSGNWDATTLNWLYSGDPAYYQQGDSVTFDDTLTGNPNVTLALNVAPGAIGFNNSSANYVLSGGFKITGPTGLTKQGSASVTLTESGGDDFSGGITVNNGTLILDNASSSISGGLTINGGTVQIGNQDANGALPGGPVTDDGALVFNQTNDVTVSTAIAGSGTLTQSGTGTLTLTGGNSYTGNTTVNSGTLALSGSGTIASSAAVSVNSATFDVSALSQPTTLNSLTLTGANINVVPSGSAAANIACASLAFGAPANHINVVSLPPIASYPVTFTIIQSVNAASGTFSMSVGLPTATPPYAANVTLSADQQAVLLIVNSGPVGLRPSVLWTGADLPNLNTNWSDRLNWQLPGAPGPGDNVIFNTTGAQTASALSTPGGGANTLVPDYLNNIVDANTTISSLTFTNANSSYHNTLINNGRTLNITNSGSLTVGSGSLDFGSTATEFVTIAGTNGTLNVNNTNGTLFVGLGSGSSGSHQATLDLSALGTFNAKISRLMVGVGSSSCGFPLARESGIVYLAQTNTITASLAVSGTETSDTNGSAVAFGIGDNDGNAGNTSCLYLGQTNAIFADAICTARQKQNAQMLFNPAFTGPSAWFRGQDGVSAVGTWSLGDGVVNAGSSSTTGINDFRGGTVNALVNTMFVGRAANTATGSGTSIGTLTFDDGVFNVGTLYLGYQPANSAKAGVGTVNVNFNATAGAGATLVVNGNLNLGLTTGGTGAASTSGTLNITNGTVQANTVIAGGGSSTINLVGGTLIVTNTAGTTAAPLTALNFTTASLHLDVNPAANATNIVATTVGTSGTTTITIDLIGGAPASATFPLIKYTGTDPYAHLSLNPSLPAGYTSGSLVDDTAKQTIDLTVSALFPSFSSISIVGGNLVITGTNGMAGTNYLVLTSTNLALPLADWNIIATNPYGPGGGFSFTNAISGSVPNLFYLLEEP
jgi:autotransporter-associated beta strand protein